MRQIGYNSQRDNFVITGIPGSSQCFATSAWMLLSFYSAHYAAGDDVGLKQYIADVTVLGSSAEYEWSAHQCMIEKYLQKAGISGHVQLGIDLNTGTGLVTPDALRGLLLTAPIIIGTEKMSGLPGGHIILGVDINANGIIVNDPYGNALTSYKDLNGAGVVYVPAMFDSANPTGNVRCMWVEQ